MVAQSPDPRAHVLNARAFRIELEFRNVGFCGEGKTGVPGEKPLGAEKRTNNKLNPHMTSSPGIEPGPHWWKASALTTAPSPLPTKLWELVVACVGSGVQTDATLRNNIQQPDATCNIQQCWELLANNVASVCTGLYM